jgi:hypothetical protein
VLADGGARSSTTVRLAAMATHSQALRVPKNVAPDLAAAPTLSDRYTAAGRRVRVGPS